jgi:hypothetical protein
MDSMGFVVKQKLLLQLGRFASILILCISGCPKSTSTSTGVAKITSKPSANTSGFDYILAPPSRVLVSQHGTLNIDPPPRV